MIFNSLPFLAFFFLFFLFWTKLKKESTIRYIYLIVSSFIFYGWWDWRFLFLIIFSGFIDFFSAKLIFSNREKPKKVKLFLIFSLIANLGILSIFKYSIFFAEQIENLLEIISISVNLKEQIPPFAYILPVGISFYTFQSMSYTIDVYRAKLKPTNNVLHFFSYLVMFPQLVAGPIVRAKDFLEQLKQNKKISSIEFWNGLKLIIIGYFQKTVLADNLGILVDKAFAGVDNGQGLYWWVVIICFAFQIYFDFSGYSQIARGLAKLMGYHFKMNFNHPYLSVSLKGFWGRWHISLSTWFRDYIYIPLGGAKKGKIRSHINLWITMLLSGLWHGASMNFILWGAYHSIILSMEKLFKIPNIRSEYKVIILLKWGATMIQILIGWVFFRSTSIEQMLIIFKQMFQVNFNYDFFYSNVDTMVFLIIAIIIEGIYYLRRYTSLFKNFKINYYLESVQYSFLILAIVFFRGPEKEFIYFQF